MDTMTPEDRIRQQAARTKAQQDIQDIDALAKNEAFNRYFVGRINDRFQKEREVALTGKTQEDRDKARHRAVILRELTQMPAEDRDSAEKFLSAPPPQPLRPTQAG